MTRHRPLALLLAGLALAPLAPDRWQIGDQKVVLALNGLPADEITRLLATLSNQLVTEALRQEELDSERYWLSWRRSLRALGSGLAGYVKRVTLSVDAKFFKLEIVGGGG